MMHEWSTMKRLIYLRGNPATGGGGGSPLTVTGATPLLMPGAVSKPMRKATFQISPVQAGSGDPSPTNIRPITGWTAANITVSGANLFKFPTYEEITSCSTTSGYFNYPIKLKPNTIYYVSNSCTSGFDPKNYGYVLLASDKSNLGWMAIAHQSVGQTSGTITTNSDGTLWLNMTAIDNKTKWDTLVENVQTMLTEGSKASPYTPYSGTTVSVEFPASVGTVYSGTIDPVTGEGVVTHKKIVLSDTLDIKQYIQTADGYSYTFRSLSINELKVGISYTEYLSTNYTPVRLSDINSSATAGKICCYSATGNQFILVTSTETTVEGFRNELTANGAYVVVPIETPIPFTIPPQSLTPPAGDAYIWADCGSTAEVTYIGKA